jgi:hypothetical protein
MNFPDYWAALVAKNPLLASAARLSVTPEKIKAMLEQAHAEGFAQAHKTESDLFNQLFRG